MSLGLSSTSHAGFTLSPVTTGSPSSEPPPVLMFGKSVWPSALFISWIDFASVGLVTSCRPVAFFAARNGA
ncbi:hypothetical protein D3C86_1974690 [compost metagenome]